MSDSNCPTDRVIARRCLISGRVQGVFYRASAAARARAIGITGYARNLPDGRVEVLACGTSAALEQFVAWLWIGPSAAKVSGVVQEVLDLALDQMPREFMTV